MDKNQGLEPEVIRNFREELSASGRSFRYIEEDEVSTDMAEFMFIGIHKGKEVIFDCLLGTLRLAYESNLHELAEAKTKEKYPDYKGFEFEVDEDGNAISDGEESEEVEEYKAYAMFEIEEAGLANVAESVESDESFEFGIGMEAYLNVAEITEETIEKFILDFNAGNLKLDPVQYSFESEDDELD
jgi:hypothetical protein